MSILTIGNLVLKLPNEEMPYIKVIPLGYKPNYRLMKYIIQLIKLNPTHWNQAEWRCGTSFCFAGFIDLLAAYQHNQKTVEQWFESDNKRDYHQTLVVSKYYKKVQEFNKKEYVGFFIEDMVELFLGINPSASHILFKSSNTLDKLESVIEQIVNDKKYWRDKYC